MNLCELVAEETARLSFLPQAKAKIINAVDPHFETDTEETILRSVIGKMLYEAMQNLSAGFIKVWAKQFHNLTVVHVKYDDHREEAFVENSLKDAELFAEQMGGCLYVSRTNMNATTVAFTFLTSVQDKIKLPGQQMYSLPRLLSA